MAVLVSLTIGLCVWLITWSLWLKPFDAFLLVLVFVLPAAAWQIYGPYIKRLLGQPEPGPPSIR